MLFPNRYSKQLQITTCTLEEAHYSGHITPDNMLDNDNAVNPADKDHASIFWVNCYTHTYKDYTREKVENTIYPLHIGLVLMLY